ncbi:MAG TPA: MDR family MFS transporter [Micromonosporaceae bacterium]|nr:MDR family MFS transporter [Micromonosporaceae bacterium]
MSAIFLTGVDVSIVAAALPTLVGEFHRPDLYSWAVTAYLLTETASVPLYGKIGDLYGRKRVLHVAIALFLVGSVLCGASGSMWQLVAFRGLQGLGAGGLVSSALAIVADITSARARGRYQGYFISTFALASLVGPLVGGFFVDGPGWRWAFYVNVPLGLLSMAVTGRLLQMPPHRGKAVVDWWGIGLVFSGVSALLLAISTGGRHYAWTSPEVAGMLAGAVVLIGCFAFRERHAREPILPLRLFGNSVFLVSMSLSFVIGAVIFGALAFMPQFLQLARGDTATQAGLMMTPMLGGAVVTSTVVGRMVSRHGRYRIFPIGGMAAMATALLLLSRVHAGIPYIELLLPITLLGVGMGLTMPILTVAVQNSVEFQDLGVASSAIVFFRSLGGSIGAAVFGAVLIARLDARLPQHVPGLHGGVNSIIDTPERVAGLPLALREGVRVSYATSMHEVFLIAAPVALAAFVLAWFLREYKLRTTSGMQQAASARQAAGERVAVPDGDP